jgi:hypothetical protein
MIKIQPIVREIILEEVEAYAALTNGYMNMSSYAYRIRPAVEALTKKQVTVNGLVVALSRLRKEFKKEKPLVQEVDITNITTKLPLSEIVYENTDTAILKLESFHKKIRITREDFFTTTVSTTELNIICSSSVTDKVLRHFNTKPKFKTYGLAAIGISFNPKHLDVPNTMFSLILVTAKARINIIELVSTYTELIFVVAEKDFGKTVALFSALHKIMENKKSINL